VGRGCSTGCGTAWGRHPAAPARRRHPPRSDRGTGARRAGGEPGVGASSKLAATPWVAHDVHIPGSEVSDDACYRAMDWLIAVEPQLVRGVFNAVADLQPRGRSDLLRHHQHLLRDRDSSGNTSMGSTRRRFTEEYKELIQNPTRCPHFRGSRTTSQDREGRSE
jgi:hypothetical protein